MDLFAQEMLEIISNPRYSDDIVTLARSTLEKWYRGITPSLATIRKLNEAGSRAPDCAHLQQDGACAWIRKYGKGHDLPVPPTGERAKCVFPTCMHKCPGYRKDK